MARFYVYDGSKYVPASVDTLTFTGAVTGSYDGSEPLNVNIPSGETDDDIINVLCETGFINPPTDSSGAILLAADNNILTL